MIREDETRLEIAQRHVREGWERLERQRTLISELIRDGHYDMVREARRFLATMEQYQAVFEILLREQQDLEGASRASSPLIGSAAARENTAAQQPRHGALDTGER